MDLESVTGLAAAALTTASNIPQLRKCWQTGSAGDLSLKAYSVLTAGVAVWAIYGVLRRDWFVTVANVISLACLLGILAIKLREDARRGGR